jgi:hypothetical protein
MYPEVEQYRAAMKAAEDKYEEAAEQAPDHDYDMIEGDCARCAFMNPSREARAAAMEAAIEQLAQAADPLVRWIAQNCLPDFDYQANKVLALLPASMDELDALASEHGWCEIWDDFKNDAHKAGVLPGQGLVTAQPEASER